MNPIKILTLTLLLPLLAACAAGGGRTAAMSDDEALQTRSMQRWESLIAGDVETAWGYLSPGYRSAHDRDTYMEDFSNRPVRWTRVEYVGHDCEQPGMSCKLKLRVHFKVRSHLTGVGLIESSSVIQERWIKSGEGWYHVPEDAIQ